MTEPPKYTTAIIAAVPAEDDPVNAHVIEDAHVTLQFLGEADTLSPEQIEEMKAALELMSSALPAFTADVAGTAELGPDKAKVLLVQSEALTRMRELLGAVPSVSTAVAASKQFPNWIPHLTLAYENDGKQVQAPGIESVQIGSLELWLADDHAAIYPLGGGTVATPEEAESVTSSVVAAGLKKFDESLHPRGADGRFIEKFGIIKYLTGAGWGYGKVEGFYTDEASGAVKVSVSPSDLSGKATGAELIELTPKQVYRAPKAKAHLPAAQGKKIGGQGGSNPGGLYKIPKPGATSAEDADEYYVKKPKTLNHGKNEALANLLYEEAGVPVPEVDLHADGQLYSKIVHGQQDMAQQLGNAEWTDQVRRNFAVDAWLGNRDVFGMTYDNVLTDPNGVPWRIDNGGALLYRAMGEKKTDFNGTVSELDVFRTGKKAKIFGPGMTKAQELDGAERVLAILPSRIDDMVSEAGMPKSLADTLKARRAYIANYYGLPLPETVQAPEAQPGSSAPKVDPPDIAENKGKGRVWFKNTLSSGQFTLQTGDLVEFPDGSTAMYGVSEDGSQEMLSVLQTQQQLLGWQQKHGADAAIMTKKVVNPSAKRPGHGEKVKGADLSAQRWRRGDKIVDGSGKDYKILGWNGDSGAVLIQHGDELPTLLDTFGNDGTGVWTVHRWDPPAAETLPEVAPEAPASLEEQPPPPTAAELGITIPEATDEIVTAPAPGKTGQAAAAETAIKADLDQPLPDGSGSTPKAKSTAPGGAKTMVLGDGTEAATGDEVVSKKDGKTYTFVKPKGQYAVVTDPTSATPDKQLLKLASTMTQPGKAPAADVSEDKPTTATGEIPQIGMMAVAKDGWAGEITLISPDGKFVFITDANGKRKRKSTGTVTITSAPSQPGPVDTADPKVDATPQDGPVKPYGAKPALADVKAVHQGLDWDPAEDLDAGDMVVVGYADGTFGLEPYTGQPIDSLATNAQGKVASKGTIKDYLGPISADQLLQADAQAQHQYVHQVVWGGILGFTDGSTGPSGGLVLWGQEAGSPDPDYAFELPPPPAGQMLSIVYTTNSADTPLVLPEGTAFQAYEPGTGGYLHTATPPLYGDEAKTLADWKGQISVGNEISLDGKNWLKVTHAYPSGAVDAQDNNGATSTLMPYSAATYVIKAPPLVDGSAPSEKFSGDPVQEKPGEPDVPTGHKKISQLGTHDVVQFDDGSIDVVTQVEPGGMPDEHVVSTFGVSDGELTPGDPAVKVLGNLNEDLVGVPAGVVAPKLYPGAVLQPIAAMKLTVVSNPSQKGDGGFSVAVMVNDDPENVTLLKIGGEGADLGPEAVVQTQFGPSSSAAKLGVNQTVVDGLFNQSVTKSDTAEDHVWEMSQQGLDAGKAQYPIFYNGLSGTYVRNGPSGQMEEFNPQDGTWNPIFGTTVGLEKVWDGAAFTGTLDTPEGEYLWPDTTGYQPKPGEAVASVQMANSGQIALVVSPQGHFGPGATWHSVLASDLLSSDAWPVEDLQAAAYTNLTVIHDPFASTEAPSGPQITHHVGDQPPVELGQKLQAMGYAPEPGQTLLTVTRPTGAMAVLLKYPDGTYRRITNQGMVTTKPWTVEEILDPQHSGEDASFFTWTYQTPDAPQAQTVEGLPTDFAPFVPGEGQAVVKQTLGNGKVSIYLQNSPGGGWYLMGPDGTVDEDSDAIKSDHVVQQKLKGLGSPNVKLELLWPAPGGSKDSEHAPPTLANQTGSWTPEPGQKVIALYTGGPDQDNDPWFWVKGADGIWTPSPNTPNMAGDLNNAEVQNLSADNPEVKVGGSVYKLVYDGGTGEGSTVDTATDTVTFHHHTPLPGTTVWQDAQGDFWAQQEPGGKWHYVKPDGGYSAGSLTQQDIDDAGDMTQVWPVEEAEPAAPGVPAETPNFGGYTPQNGDKIVSADLFGKQTFLIQQAGTSDYKLIKPDGTINPHGGATQQQIESGEIANEQVWPTPEDQGTTGGIFNGYQSLPGESVVLYTEEPQQHYVKKDDGWYKILSGGTLATEPYSQDTIEWGITEYGGQVVQGTLKDAADDQPLDLSTGSHAGVSETVTVTPGSYSTEDGFQLTANQKLDLEGTTLQPGQSAWVTGTGLVLVRNSDGTWHSVYGGQVTHANYYDSDEEAENYYDGTSSTFQLHKVTFTAPTAPPVVTTGPPPTIPLTEWQGKIPDPASFGQLADPSDAIGLKKGQWVFIKGAGTTGLFAQLAEDLTDPANFSVGNFGTTQDGKVNPIIESEANSGWTLLNAGPGAIYVSGTPTGTPAPVEAPAVATPAAPAAKPAYPGALLPSAEDIAAWGGGLTKDGHIPTAGMYVSGKGPMSGKIINVSKDKTKATVLTSDGKKTTRLIAALKTDKTANYQAYAAPATVKDVPQGMPLAVDTVAEALQKTVQDGKFRAVVTAHPGVSGGQMTVTKATGPSGKKYNRVHLTLTPEQREVLLATLAGGGEKGDWVKASKLSDEVVPGDLLTMRKSSQNNPDGTPRWKVDPDVKPPTHEVVGVTDDPAGGGIKLVTLKDRNTGEEITSRFHPGKSLNLYSWDPDKPKTMAPGAFSLSETAKADGWTYSTEGGISAATGGADSAQLKVEPGKAVAGTHGAFKDAGSSWETLRNVSADGVVVEVVAPKGPAKNSTTGVTVISIPEGVDETAFQAALARMTIPYAPMTQDSAKDNVRGALRTLLHLDISDVNTAKGWTDEKLFDEAGKVMGIGDLGWQDVLVGVDESTGKTSFFWSDRARNALAAKAGYNLVYRAASNASAAQIVSTVKYGSANSVLKRTTGMVDGSAGQGGGASWGTDQTNLAGHGSYASASKEAKLPAANKWASYKTPGMMIYHRPEAVLGRIMDIRVASSDAFGMGQGSGANHLKHATQMSSVRDYFLGGGLPTEAVGFIAVSSATERTKAIAQLKADGFAEINGRPVEEIVILKDQAVKMTPADLPPVTLPANARSVLDLPNSYDAPAAPAVTAAAVDDEKIPAAEEAEVA